jgi:hypothetical protein
LPVAPEPGVEADGGDPGGGGEGGDAGGGGGLGVADVAVVAGGGGDGGGGGGGGGDAGGGGGGGGGSVGSVTLGVVIVVGSVSVGRPGTAAELTTSADQKPIAPRQASASRSALRRRGPSTRIVVSTTDQRPARFRSAGHAKN